MFPIYNLMRRYNTPKANDTGSSEDEDAVSCTAALTVGNPLRNATPTTVIHSSSVESALPATTDNNNNQCIFAGDLIAW